MVSLASRLPDIELLPGDGPPRAAPPPPPPPWRAPPTPDIERIGAPRGRSLRRPLAPAPGAPRAAAHDLAAAGAAAPRARAAARGRPRPHRPGRPPSAVDLDVPAFLARPRPAPAPAAPALPPPPLPAPARPRRRRRPAPLGPHRGDGRRARGPRRGRVHGSRRRGRRGRRRPFAGAVARARPHGRGCRRDPPDYLALYRQFGLKMDIDWRFLAAIGAQESDHGRNRWAARVNPEGCVGPMQLGVGGRCGDFVGTWGVDGDGDGGVDPRQPADAIATAARGLRLGKGAPPRGGAGGGYRQAACGVLRRLRRRPGRLRRRGHGPRRELRVPGRLSRPAPARAGRARRLSRGGPSPVPRRRRRPGPAPARPPARGAGAPQVWTPSFQKPRTLLRRASREPFTGSTRPLSSGAR